MLHQIEKIMLMEYHWLREILVLAASHPVITQITITQYHKSKGLLLELRIPKIISSCTSWTIMRCQGLR